VGADRPEQVDVRILSATHQDLQALQTRGEFREDLFWRIKGAEISLPPLRERIDDIPLLATHFLNQAAALSPDGRRVELSEEATRLLTRHHWPGNLRELRHEMQRATVMCRSPVLSPSDFSFPERDPLLEANTLQEQVEALERREISLALQRHDGNRTRAADDLGLSRQGLLNKINRYGLT
jgi:two-component system, NtrC family, response regulator AtoC